MKVILQTGSFYLVASSVVSVAVLVAVSVAVLVAVLSPSWSLETSPRRIAKNDHNQTRVETTERNPQSARTRINKGFSDVLSFAKR